MKENKNNFLKAVEEAKQRLAAGKKPEDVFDNYDDFDEGFTRVVIDGKYNYINSDRKLLSDTWFDWCGYFGKRFAIVKLNKKWNYIDRNGYILSTTWFDDCRCFRDGFATVELSGIYYCLRKDGVLCNYHTKEPIESANTDYKKKYEQALERASHIKDYNTIATPQEVAELLFPELKESEDERIRKALIENFKFFGGDYLETSKWGKNDDLLVTDILAWLEKQGEQTSNGKVEPKFKVGDCIRHKGADECYKIVTMDENYYFCENNHAWNISSQDYFELAEQKPA